ncbi:MAG: cupin domain-containing protein [Chitinophagales bacterium]
MKANEIVPAQTFIFADSIEYASDSIVSKTIVKRPTGNITLFAFDQGQALSEHTAPFNALVQVIDGQAEIIIAQTIHRLTAGQNIILPANIAHAVNATTPLKMVLTMIKDN